MKKIFLFVILTLLVSIYCSRKSFPTSKFVKDSPLITKGKVEYVKEYSNEIKDKYTMLFDTAFYRISKIYKNEVSDTIKVGSMIKLRMFSRKNEMRPVGDGSEILDREIGNILSFFGDSTFFYTVEHFQNDSIILRLVDENNLNFKLMDAIEDEDIDSIKTLIKKGTLINSSNAYNYFDYHWSSPLFKAIETGNFDVFKTIIYNGADVFAKDRHGNNAFLWAAECGNIQALQFLYDNYVFDISSHDIYGINILEKAAGSPECLQYLIDKGAKINIINGQKFTPLEAAIDKKNPESIKTLLLNGADPNLYQKYLSPLHNTLDRGFDLPIIGLMVDKGAEINSRDLSGKTPIFTALRYNKIEIVEYLISKGADIKMLDYKGNNVLMNLRSNGSMEVNKKIELIQYILNFGIDINAVNVDGNSYIFLELEHSSDRNYDLIKKLVELGADTKIKNKAGQGLKEVFEKNPFKEKPKLQELVNSLIE